MRYNRRCARECERLCDFLELAVLLRVIERGYAVHAGEQHCIRGLRDVHVVRPHRQQVLSQIVHALRVERVCAREHD